MSMKLKCTSLLFIIIGFCHEVLSVSQNSQDYLNKLSDYFRNESVNARQLVTEIPTEAWDTFEKRVYEGGSKQKLQDLLNSGRSNIPLRARSLILEVLFTKLYEWEVIQRLRSATSEFEIFKLCELIPRPSTWTKENITRNWSILKKCPSNLLLEINDRDAIDLLLTNLQRETGKQYKLLAAQIFMKQYGEPSSWSVETFRNIELSEEVLPYICMEIDEDVLVSRQSDVLSRISRLSSSEKQPCIEKMIEAVGLREASSSNEANAKLGELSTIQNELMPNDFHRDVLNDQNIASILDRNVKIKLEQGDLRPDGALRILYAFGNESEKTKEIISKYGICALSLALPSQLLEASIARLYSLSDIINIVKCINNYRGPGADAKFEIMAERIINESDPRRTLTLGQYPAEIQREYGYDQWIRVEPSDARQILSKPMNGTPQETGRLIDKLSKGDLTNVHPSVREILPYYLLNDITSGDAVKLLTGVQPGAAIGLKAAEKFMEGQNKILGPNDVSRLQTILPHFGAAQAYRFDERYIMDIFRAMGTNAKLTMHAAVVLQHKFENFTANISRTYINNPMLYLSGYDIETIPVSVLCAFSPMEISQLSSAHKIVLLKRLGWVEDIEFRCPRNIRMVIVTEGFNAMGSSRGIQPTDVGIIGNAILDTPYDVLQGAHKMAKPIIIKRLNDLVDMRRVKPCWGSSQRRAVAQLIKDAYGSDLGSWNSIDAFSCILYTFDEEDLQQIRPEVLASKSCESRNLFPSDLCLQAICNGSLGVYEFMLMKEAEMNFMESQRKAASKIIDGLYETRGRNETRRRRETTREDVNRTCDKAAYGGANAFSETELQNIAKDVLALCFTKLGRYPIEERKAEILARKLMDYRLIRGGGYAKETLKKMRYIWNGLPSQTISQSLDEWASPYDMGLVDAIGKLNFNEEQTRAIATKLRREMGFDLSSQNATEYQMISKFICGFAPSVLDQLNVTAVRDSLPGLSQMVNCTNIEALQQLFKAVQTSVGNIDKWKASDITQFGVIFSGIQPEEWLKVNVMEMEGVTPLAVRQFTNNTIRAMNVTHIEHMSPCALASFTDEQKLSFSSTMRQALERSSRLTRRKGSGVANLEMQSTLIIFFSIISLVPFWYLS